MEYRTVGSTRKLESIAHAEGRRYNVNVNTGTSTESLRLEYSIRDHLGNNRLMFTDKNSDGKIDVTTTSTNEILSEQHYYPFGLSYGGNLWMNEAADVNNRYLYNGKELTSDHGLGWYNYGARWYDPSVGRWNAIDPLAEKYMSVSPYAYVANNPLIFIDPDGKKIKIGTIFQFKFRHQVKEALKNISKSQDGQTLVNNLQRTTNSKGERFIVRINKSVKGQSSRLGNEPNNTGATVPANLKGEETATAKRDALPLGLATERSAGKMVGTGKGTSSNIAIDPSPDLPRPAEGTFTTTLAHELKHASDISEGELNPNTMDPIGNDPGDENGRGPKRSEYAAVLFENIIRATLDMKKRTTYGDRLIIPNGQ